MPSWDSAAADDLWTKACGKGRWLGTTEALKQDIHRVSDASLWQFRTDAARLLLNTLASDCTGNWPRPARRTRRLTGRNIYLIPTR